MSTRSDLTISGTWWPGVTSRVGSPFRLSWYRFCQRFVFPLRATSKQLLPGWSPAWFNEDRRGLEHVTHCFALGLDIDAANSFDEICAPWRNTTSLVHTTFTHTTVAPRARIILPLSRPVTREEHAHVWQWAAKRMSERGLALDAATRDPSRLWFVPASPADGDYRAIVHHGELLDVDLASNTEARVEAAKTLPVALVPRSSNNARVIDRARLYLERCEPAVSGQAGSVKTFLVAQKLVRGFGLSEELAFELLAENYNSRCKPPWSRRDLERKVREAARVGQMTIGSLLRGDR